MDETEFQQQLRRQLLSDGIFDEITAQLRSRIFRSLRGENGPPKSKTSQQEMALLSLFYYHIENRGYDGTLSVFVSECGMQQPLPARDAIKALGLEEILCGQCAKDNGDLSIGLLPLLQAVAQHSANATNLDSSENTTAHASKSVQTDQQFVKYSDPKHDKENCNVNHSSIKKGRSTSKLVEQRLIEIENECQQRMRQEMNEKLRLSAKKQAIQATRRLERKHKEEIQSLYHQIEVEREIAQRRQDEIVQSLSQKHLSAQSEKSKIEQKLETTLLEKQTLQSEMALANERERKIQHEWSEEHKTLSRAHRESLNELEAQKRHLQIQINEMALQKEALASKELKHAATERERDNLRSEIEGLRHQNAQAQSNLESQLTKIQQMYNSSRSEVSGLRSLLKQSHTALQTLSFRDIGKESVDGNLEQRMICTRGASVLSNQSRPKETLKAGANPHLAAALSARSNDALAHNESIINLSSSDAQADNFVQGQLNNQPPGGVQQSSIRSNANLNKQDCTANINSNPKPDNDVVKEVMSEDPPCTSAEDPPETIERDGDGRHDKTDDDIVNSVDTVVGREILLSLSAITEEPSADKEFVAPAASRQEVNVSAAKTSQPVDSPTLNVASSDKGEESETSNKTPGVAELKLLVSKNLAHSIAEAQVSTSSLASEANEFKSENYSECFDESDEGINRSLATQGSKRPDNERDSISSSSEYTESFCSEPLYDDGR